MEGGLSSEARIYESLLLQLFQKSKGKLHLRVPYNEPLNPSSVRLTTKHRTERTRNFEIKSDWVLLLNTVTSTSVASPRSLLANTRKLELRCGVPNHNCSFTGTNVPNVLRRQEVSLFHVTNLVGISVSWQQDGGNSYFQVPLR